MNRHMLVMLPLKLQPSRSYYPVSPILLDNGRFFLTACRQEYYFYKVFKFFLSIRPRILDENPSLVAFLSVLLEYF